MKTLKTVITAGVVASLLTAGAAFAEVSTATSPTINVTSTPVTTAITPGSQNVNLGTFQFSGGPIGASSIASVPLTLTTTGGASAADLSNCAIVDSTGHALTANVNSISSGSNTFSFTTPQSFTGGTNTTYSIRCNIAAAANANGRYAFNAGTPRDAAGLMINFTVAPSVVAGTNSTIGLITLDASRSGSDIRVPSLPITTSFANGASNLNLSGCSVRNINSIGTSLSNGTNTVASIGNANTFTFDSPVVVSAGTSQTFAIVCSVNSATPVGSTFNMSVLPSGITAVDAASGTNVTPSAALGASGTPMNTSGSLTVVAPGTGTGTGSGTGSDTGTPGVPNTGFGGDAPMNVAVLAFAALASVLGLSYLSRRTV